MLDGIALIHKAFADSLRVLLDFGLLFDKQLEVVVRTAYYQLGLVRQLHPFLDEGLSHNCLYLGRIQAQNF